MALEKQTLDKNDELTNEYIYEMAVKISEAAMAKKLPIKLLGATAFINRCPNYRDLYFSFGRRLTDVDVVTYGSVKTEVIDSFFTDLGFEKQQHFIWHAGTRDIFISTDGLVGRVTSVTKRSCEVLLIVDPGCKVACKVVRNGAFGIMQGSGIAMHGNVSLEMLASVKPSILDYVSTEHELQPRDVIHTSGLGNVFPEGLPIGRLGAVKMHSSGLYQQAEVVPSADIDSLKYAFVVIE